ncbi:MAG TPA: hypothetical protein VIX90_01385 [Edaphobacter sp.]
MGEGIGFGGAVAGVCAGGLFGFFFGLAVGLGVGSTWNGVKALVVAGSVDARAVLGYRQVAEAG